VAIEIAQATEAVQVKEAALAKKVDTEPEMGVETDRIAVEVAEVVLIDLAVTDQTLTDLAVTDQVLIDQEDQEETS
jgi:hypothetical protein